MSFPLFALLFFPCSVWAVLMIIGGLLLHSELTTDLCMSGGLLLYTGLAQKGASHRTRRLISAALVTPVVTHGAISWVFWFLASQTWLFANSTRMRSFALFFASFCALLRSFALFCILALALFSGTKNLCGEDFFRTFG